MYRLGVGEASTGGGVFAQTLTNECVPYWMVKPNQINALPWEVPVWCEDTELQPCPNTNETFGAPSMTPDTHCRGGWYVG